MLQNRALNILQLCFVFLFLAEVEGTGSSSYEKVKLKDVSKLTLTAGYYTNGRRSLGVPQLKCVGGSAGCHVFTAKTVECHNHGRVGKDYTWDCLADMDHKYKFGLTTVTCEGYDFPDDEYILRGSCGLVYTIDLKTKDEASTIAVIGFVIVVVVAVGLYKMFLAPTESAANKKSDHDQENPHTFDSQPPPPGFRTGFTNTETRRR